MDSNLKPTPSEAHPETMDFLSRAWCSFAVQALQPELQDRSIVLLDNPIKESDCHMKSAFSKMDKSVKIDDSDFKPLPPWKSNDLKTWIWMQQAMHPELNYKSCFRKKWFPWKKMPFRTISIKKWLKELKLKRKDDNRLQRAEVHAAISVAGVAASLAAIAAENSEKGEVKEAAIASAAALVAAHCAQAAEAMGAKREQLSSVMGSAMSGTSASDILTLTAAAATSLRGAATLKARTGCKNRVNGCAPVLPIEHSNDTEFDFEKYRSMLSRGAELHVETPDGNFRVRPVSIILNSQAKVILKMRKLNLLKSKKESIILDMHAEPYKESEADQETDDGACYLIVLTTDQGIIKLDMGDDYHRYRTWAATISHMLVLSNSFTKYDLKYHKS